MDSDYITICYPWRRITRKFKKIRELIFTQVRHNRYLLLMDRNPSYKNFIPREVKFMNCSFGENWFSNSLKTKGLFIQEDETFLRVCSSCTSGANEKINNKSIYTKKKIYFGTGNNLRLVY